MQAIWCRQRRRSILREFRVCFVYTTTMPPDLDHLLAAYRQKPLPTAPANLETSVWRSIRLKTEESGRFGRYLEGLLAWLEDSRLTGTAVIAAVTIGIVFSFALAPAPSMKRSMGLDVFSQSSVSSLARLASNP